MVIKSRNLLNKEYIVNLFILLVCQSVIQSVRLLNKLYNL